VAWLQKEAIRVRTVDPADEDFRDLEPLKKMIGDARIVMLGEISHGDGTTMLAKSRLVRFLHQQMDFDVLVFESGLYDTSTAWESMVDLRTPAAGGEWLQSPIISRPLANQGMRAVWPNVLDAMFFIRVMQPNQAVLR
jgi:hypothetical protein